MKKHITHIVSLAVVTGFLAVTSSIIQARAGSTLSVTSSSTVIKSGGSQGICPGSYAGYAYFYNTNSPSNGFTPAPGATVMTATDTNRTDTKIEYVGYKGDTGCNLTNVAIPYPAYSSNYVFMVYFPNNVPTNNYSILLTGFNP